MSWHCERWYENLTGTHSYITWNDGDDWDELYTEARCTSFDQSGYFTVDEDGDVIDSGPNDDLPTCNEHERTASSDEPDIPYDLEGRAGLQVCTDCETVYSDHNNYYEHRADEHGDGEDDEESGTAYQRQDADGNYVPIPPPPPSRRPASIRPTTISTHSAWY